MMAHNGEGGIFVTAYGYTTNASEGPLSATSPTGTSRIVAKFPRYENMTNPAKKLVRQLPKATVMASLKRKYEKDELPRHDVIVWEPTHGQKCQHILHYFYTIISLGSYLYK